MAIRTLFLLTVILSLCASGIAADVTDHRIIVEIDGGISIVPPSSETRAMLGMVRHPDETWYDGRVCFRFHIIKRIVACLQHGKSVCLLWFFRFV